MRDIGQFYVTSVEGVTRADGTLLQVTRIDCSCLKCSRQFRATPGMDWLTSMVLQLSTALAAGTTSRSVVPGLRNSAHRAASRRRRYGASTSRPRSRYLLSRIFPQ